MIITQPSIVYPDPTDVIPLQVVRVPIGTWDMYNDFQKIVNCGVDQSEIFHITAMIYTDNGLYSTPCPNSNTNVLQLDCNLTLLGGDTILMTRSNPSIFYDSPDYVNPFVNRGYLHILRRISN